MSHIDDSALTEINLNDDSQNSSREPWKWRKTSPELLAQSESRILSRLKTPYKSQFVDIGPLFGSKSLKIWTISLNEKSQKIPLVLIHGLGAGVAHWTLNLDTLAADRPVYAIDNLGFARSGRPKFSAKPEEAERQFVRAVEEWREKLNLQKLILLGHSLGGYISFSYALSYPQRVAHLILADPWGFTEKPESRTGPFWTKVLIFTARRFNPFAAIRAAGPAGQKVLERAMGHLIEEFSELNEQGDVKFGDYLYHCNVQEPSGEAAFRTMMDDYRWAKHPMIRRMPLLSPEVDMMVIWGGKSFLHRISSEKFAELRPNCYTDVQIIEESGHDVHSEAKNEFNQLVLKSCAVVDSKN